ncbi:hypothetical protein PFISCL1PPCAC_13885, partial [Pristionchus fissidentatus]
LCIVCGGGATGYHYEAPSCTSCKTFFRRTVLQQRVFTSCFKNGACSSTGKQKATRQCRYCRFEKCIDAGMNPLLITSLPNPESNVVARRILMKRECDGTEAIVQLPQSPGVLECKIDRIIGGLLYLESAHQRLRASKFNPSPEQGYRLDAVLVGHSRLSMLFQDCVKTVRNKEIG